MIFNSLAFAVFLPIVLAVYYALSRRAQNAWLLAASYVFYGWWDVRFLSLLWLSTIVDFTCARRIEATSIPRRRRAWLLVTLGTNLTVLGFFKYFDFFAGSVAHVLRPLGLAPPLPVLHVVLPIGISFYTFQTMSYTIDVYRREIPACRSLLDFALFVGYFPHLVAGPIMRAGGLLTQIQKERRVGWNELREGGVLILVGLFKKVGVADAVAPIVDLRFGSPSLYGGWDLLLAVYLFAIQIYCDFSGYSDIARGVSKLLGIELIVNFDHPYFATTITDFWRRWHISLSTWLRDYLYIPLGGNRKGEARTYLNLMITMLLGGLWHGASWSFVVWGGLHGLYLSIHKLVLERGRRAGRARREVSSTGRTETAGPGPGAGTPRIPAAAYQGASTGLAAAPSRAAPLPLWRGLAGRLATFHLVLLSWIFFRARTLAGAWEYLTRIVTWQPPGRLEALDWPGLRLGILLVVLAAIESAQYLGRRHTVFLDWPWPARAALYGSIVVVIVVCGGLDAQVPFIYFQF